MKKIFGLRKRFYIPPLIALLCMYAASFYYPNIEVRHVYNVCPVFIVYTDSFVGDGNSGTCRGPIILIRPEYKDDLLVETHEVVHAKQSYRTFFLGWIKCFYDQEYLAKVEAEAYAIEITDYTQISTYAKMIQNEYAPETDVRIIEDYLYRYWDECTRCETCYSHIQANQLVSLTK